MGDIWFKCEEELPSHDGYYQITNSPDPIAIVGVAFYDGIGFRVEHAYREPLYWRCIAEKLKRYGKQK